MSDTTTNKAEIYYYDIGDYLSREEKFKIIADFGSMENLPFTRITPNEHGDWIAQRNDKFSTWIAIEPDKKFNEKAQSFFTLNSRGFETARDFWVYTSSKEKLKYNISVCSEEYKRNLGKKQSELNYDSSKISWSSSLISDVKNSKPLSEYTIQNALYRPFFKQNVYFGETFIHRMGQMKEFFPTPAHKNLVICTKGVGDKPFSCLISDCIPDLQVNFNGQCFPLYWYEEVTQEQGSLFADEGTKYIRHDAVSDFILDRARTKYGGKVTKEDIFYYVYGLLHSPSYRAAFAADLKKMLPRIPLVSDYKKFFAFVEAGRKLAELHVHYETVAPCPTVTVESLEQAQYKIDSSVATLPQNDRGELMVADSATTSHVERQRNISESDYAYYAVEQMKFPKKGEKGTIIYNHWHTVTNIPEKAYEYVVNGKSAIEWIMERYAITTDKKSGITNNPNDWSREHQKPRYILDLLLSVINVSVQTVDIVNALPEVDWEKE